MNIILDKKSKLSLSEQICQSIIEQIQTGLFKPGEQLPSVRNLSTQIEVSVLTVLQAYKKLEELGYAIRKHGKGTYLSSSQDQREDTQSTFAWQSTVRDYIGRSGFGQQTKQSSGEILYPLHLAALSPEYLPIEPVQKAIRAASEDIHFLRDYVPLGDNELRKKLAEYLQRLLIPIHPSELMITTGCQQGIDLVAKTFLGPGDVVAVESLTYPAALDVFRSRGATVVPIPEDHTGIRIDLLTKLFDQRPPKLLYITPTGQNPTGRMLDAKTRSSLLQVATGFNCLILEDDPWGELYFDTSPLPSLFSMDTSGHVIYLKGFSKTIAPSLRIGTLMAKGSIFQRLVHAKAFTDLCTPQLNQRAFLHLLKSFSLEKYFKQLRTSLFSHLQKVEQILKANASDLFHWECPKAGPNIWLQTKYSNTDILLSDTTREGVTFLPGSICYPGVPDTNFLRIGFASTSLEKIEKGISVLAQLTREKSKNPVVNQYESWT
jgi:DNA-binding transcriptional MocR family regulator